MSNIPPIYSEHTFCVSNKYTQFDLVYFLSLKTIRVFRRSFFYFLKMNDPSNYSVDEQRREYPRNPSMCNDDWWGKTGMTTCVLIFKENFIVQSQKSYNLKKSIQ
jgi:hypothetical protein